MFFELCNVVSETAKCCNEPCLSLTIILVRKLCVRSILLIFSQGKLLVTKNSQGSTLIVTKLRTLTKDTTWQQFFILWRYGGGGNKYLGHIYITLYMDPNVLKIAKKQVFQK